MAERARPEDLVATLHDASTATLTTQLPARGIRNARLAGVRRPPAAGAQRHAVDL